MEALMPLRSFSTCCSTNKRSRAAFCQGLVSDDALISQRLLGVEEIFGKAIPNSPEFVAAFERCYASLRDKGVTQTLQTLLKKSA